MQEKVKVRWNSMQKRNIFKPYRKLKIYFYCQNQLFALHNLRLIDGTSTCTAKVCVVRPSWAKLFNLIQVFPLLQLALLPFSLLSPTHINFTCNVLMFVIRYEIMLITSSGLHVPK